MNSYTQGTILRHKRTRKRFIIDEVMFDDETYYVRALLGPAPYGPSQPRTVEQLIRLYEVID